MRPELLFISFCSVNDCNRVRYASTFVFLSVPPFFLGRGGVMELQVVKNGVICFEIIVTCMRKKIQRWYLL
jgi:hypothetical protein